jgi:hypothetical protein
MALTTEKQVKTNARPRAGFTECLSFEFTRLAKFNWPQQKEET